MREKIRILLNAVRANETGEDVEDIIDAIDDALDGFRKYFNAVFQDVKSEEIGRAKLNAGIIFAEDFKDMREQTDSTRRIVHDAAIAKCAMLNRLCKKYELAPICPETNDRTEIADFIGTFVYNIYQEGIGKTTLDKAYDVANDSFEARTEYAMRTSAILNATKDRYPKQNLNLGER